MSHHNSTTRNPTAVKPGVSIHNDIMDIFDSLPTALTALNLAHHNQQSITPNNLPSASTTPTHVSHAMKQERVNAFLARQQQLHRQTITSSIERMSFAPLTSNNAAATTNATTGNGPSTSRPPKVLPYDTSTPSSRPPTNHWLGTGHSLRDPSTAHAQRLANHARMEEEAGAAIAAAAAATGSPGHPHPAVHYVPYAPYQQRQVMKMDGLGLHSNVMSMSTVGVCVEDARQQASQAWQAKEAGGERQWLEAWAREWEVRRAERVMLRGAVGSGNEGESESERGEDQCGKGRGGGEVMCG